MDQPDALILTGIGIGTAFSVLIFLLVAVLIIRLVARLLNKDEQESAAQEGTPTNDPDMRNRATAAAIAVTVLLESRPYLHGEPNSARDE